MVRKKVPSPVFIYNTFNQTYFRYFYGHYVKYTKHVDINTNNYIQNFIDNHFDKLSFSLTNLENYLLWLFATYGKLPLTSIHGFIDEYINLEEKSLDIKPFSNVICKYIRDEKIKSWKEYLLPQGGFYPKIIQHYMKDKSFPFEFILFLKILDRVSDKQKKMLKSMFREELYNVKEKMEVVEKNKHFFTEEIKKINEEFN